MKHQQEKKQKGVLWRVLFAIVILLMAAVLELGKHTLLGSPGRPCGRFRPWPEKQAA